MRDERKNVQRKGHFRKKIRRFPANCRIIQERCGTAQIIGTPLGNMFIKRLAFSEKICYNIYQTQRKEECIMDMKRMLLDDVDDLIFMDDIWTSSER